MKTGRTRGVFILFLTMFLVVAAIGVFAGGSEEEAKEEKAAGEKVVDEPMEKEKYKVGFVFSNPIGDQGWTYAQDQGRQWVQNNIPNVETVFVAPVPAGADAERVIRQFAEEGCDMIITNSFSFVDSVETLAPQYPDVLFESYEGFTTSENHSIHRVQTEQAGYIAGLLGGKMTKSNIIGFVAAFPITDVLRHINAATKAARSVNPKVTVRVVWINSWYNPVKEKEAAEGLIALGADVLIHNQASAATLQAGEAAGVFVVGYTDQDKFAPNYLLTSEAINWGVVYGDRIQAMVDGTWRPQEKMYTMADKAIYVTPYGPKVPAGVKQMADEMVENIKSGKFNIWEGPVTDQDGNVHVAPGEVMSMEQMLSVKYLLEGVEGTIPK